MLVTLLMGRKEPQPPIAWAEPLGEPAGGYRAGIWDRLGFWFVIAVVLVLIAYGYPLWDHFQMERFGSPGFKPF
jgi:cytochrome c oxidase subunit 1